MYAHNSQFKIKQLNTEVKTRKEGLRENSGWWISKRNLKKIKNLKKKTKRFLQKKDIHLLQIAS